MDGAVQATRVSALRDMVKPTRDLRRDWRRMVVSEREWDISHIEQLGGRFEENIERTSEGLWPFKPV